MEGPSFFPYVVRSLLQDAGLIVSLLGLSCLLLIVALGRASSKGQQTDGSSSAKESRHLLRTLQMATLFVGTSTGVFGALCLAGSARLLAAPLVARGTPPVSVQIGSGSTAINPCWPRAQSVVVLSGGLESSSMPSLHTLLRIEAAAAMVSAESLSDQPYSLVVLSGGPGDPGLDVSEAAVMRPSFLRYLSSPAVLGQAGGATEIALEQSSLTTFENALFTRKLFADRQKAAHIDLVTSAEHMWRARLVFEAQGFQVCPRPAMPRRFHATRLFSFRQASFSIDVIHEWLGLAGYLLAGRLTKGLKN